MIQEFRCSSSISECLRISPLPRVRHLVPAIGQRFSLWTDFILHRLIAGMRFTPFSAGSLFSGSSRFNPFFFFLRILFHSFFFLGLYLMYCVRSMGSFHPGNPVSKTLLFVQIIHQPVLKVLIVWLFNICHMGCAFDLFEH